MKLTDDDYLCLSAQCAVQNFGRIDRDGEMFYVSMSNDVLYEREDDYFNGTGGRIPMCAECRVKDFCFDTKNGSDVEFDAYKLEEMTHEFLMRY